MTKSSNMETSKEIDLISIIKLILANKKFLIKVVVIFIFVGIFMAIFTPKKYSVKAIVVPHLSNTKSNLGGLSSLAAIAGFNLNLNNNSELSPMIYPKIVNSIPFQKELIHTKLKFVEIDEEISLFDYYTNPQYTSFGLFDFIKKHTIGLPKTIRLKSSTDDKPTNEKDQNNGYLSLSAKEHIAIEMMSKVLFLDLEDRDGYLKLKVILPEAKPAAQLGQKALELLQKYIIRYKIEKAQAQLDFIEGRYNTKKEEFEKAQLNLAKFRDKNKFMSKATALAEEERLESEYQIAITVYTELAKQLENAKISVKEETPILTVIEPITLPNEHFKPKRKLILIFWMGSGFVIGTLLILLQTYFKRLAKTW